MEKISKVSFLKIALLLVFMLTIQVYGSKEDIVAFRYNGYKIIPNYDIDRSILSRAYPVDGAGLQQKLDFWGMRFFNNLYSIEKNSYEGDATSLRADIELLSKDLKRMKQDTDSDLLFLSCYAIILESFSRLVSDSKSLKNNLSDDLLEKSLDRDLLNSNLLKHWYTYATMLIIAKRLEEYKISKGHIPSQINKLISGNKYILDAWGQAIEYYPQEDKWVLLSHSGVAEKTFSATTLTTVPYFNGSNFSKDIPLGYSSDFSQMRRKLWEDGVLEVPPFTITIYKKSGSLSTGRAISRQK